MIFSSPISAFSQHENLWANYLPIPQEVFDQMLLLAPDKRVKCIYNDQFTHYAAMMPYHDFHYLLLNKETLKTLNATLGDTIRVQIEKSDLEYGIPICDEFRAVLDSDTLGSSYFHSLTKGVQRSLIHLINKIKNPQLRIDRTILILNHLIDYQGKLDFKKLTVDFKAR